MATPFSQPPTLDARPRSLNVRLQRIRSKLSQVHHDLKNPLSVIDGNAQFLLELQQALDLDEQAVASVEDIREATEELRDSMEQLQELRDQLETSQLE